MAAQGFPSIPNSDAPNWASQVTAFLKALGAEGKQSLADWLSAYLLTQGTGRTVQLPGGTTVAPWSLVGPKPQRVNFQAPWAAVAGFSVKWIVDPIGWAAMTGRVIGGGAGTTILELPIGVRPKTTWTFQCANDAAAYSAQVGVVTVDKSGNLVMVGAPGASYVDLSAVRFLVEQ